MKYLPSIDRAGVLRRMGSILMLDKVALRRAMERQYTGQQQWKGAAVECSNSGVAHSPVPVAVETAWKEEIKKEANGRA